MEKKTFEERYSDENFTDNTQIPKYEQCKNCMFRRMEINGVSVDDYRRTSCSIYSFPEMKPLGILDGSIQCEYYEKEK